MRKLFTYGVVAATILWSLGIAAVVPVSAAYTPSAGDYVKTATDTAVYYIDVDGKRHLFSNLVTFRSWESASWGDLVSSGELKVISQDDFDALPAAANVLARPGVNLIRFDNSPKTYAVAPGGVLHHVTTADTAVALYGSNWESKVIIIQSAFETNYSKTGADLTASSKLPDGSLIKYSGEDQVYYIEDGEKRPVTDEAFVANGFMDSAVITVSASMTYNTGSSVTGEEADLMTVAGPGSTGGTTPVTGTNLSVALASNTPSSGVVMDGTTRNHFTKVRVTAGTDGAIVIDSWEIKRGGIAQDSDFSGVNIIDDSTNRTISDIDKTFNSNSLATITNDVTVPAGTTKTFTLVGTMASAPGAGNTPSLILNGLVLKNGTVSGSLPIEGNRQTINSNVTVGQATIQRGSFSNATTSSSAPTKVGEMDYTVFAFQIAGPSEENVQLEWLRLYQTGSASLANDLTNIKLYNALTGAVLATGQADGNYVYFDLAASPFQIDEGDTEQFKVTANIDSGSQRTIKLAINRDTDILIKGLTNNAYRVVSLTGTGSSTVAPYLTDNEFYIGAGTFTVQKSNQVPTTNISLGSDQELGAFEFDVKGEDLNVTALTLTVASSSSASVTDKDALSSVKLVDATGNTVAGPVDRATSALTFAFTDTLQIPVGKSVYKVLGKVDSNKGWATDNTITMSIATPATAITATGETTGQSITSDSTATVTANQQTIKAASLTVSKNSNPGDQTVVVGSTGVRLGGWSLDATNAGEDIRITQLVFAGSGQSATNTTDLAVYMDGAQQGTTQSALSTQPASATFTFSSPIIVPKGTSKVIELKGNKTSVASDATEQWGLTDTVSATNASVVAYGKDTGIRATVSLTQNDGATITSAPTGSLSIVKDGAPSEQIVISSTGMQLMNKLRFTATNSDITVTQIIVTVADGTTTGTATGDVGDIDRVYLKSAGSFVGNSAGYAVNTARTTINLDPGFVVPQGASGKLVDVYADVASIGSGPDDSATGNASVLASIAGANSITARDSAQGTVTPTVTATSSNFVLHQAKPVVVQTSGSQTSTASGDQILYTMNVTASDGPIELYRLSFLTATTELVSLTNGYVQLASCSGCAVGGVSVSAPQRISALQGVANAAGLSTGQSLWSFALDNIDTSSLTQESLRIPEGATATLRFRASIDATNWSSTTTRSIVSYVLGDASATTTDETGGDTASEFTALNQGNFVWSDLYVSSVGANTTSSAQWFNGNLISGANEATSTSAYTYKSL